MSIFNKNRKRQVNYDTKIIFAKTYDIPFDLVEKIFSFTKHGENFWGNITDPTTLDDYKLMLEGASIAYHNQYLMGRALPPNDERAIGVTRYLVSQGLAIQFHPHHGMQIIQLELPKKED